MGGFHCSVSVALEAVQDFHWETFEWATDMAEERKEKPLEGEGDRGKWDEQLSASASKLHAPGGVVAE